MFCPYKTYEPTFSGGTQPCQGCAAGAKNKQLSKASKFILWAILIVLLLLLVIKICRRKAGRKMERLKGRINLDAMNARIRPKTEVKREQEKYARLRPKLEVISARLSKIRRGDNDHDDPQDAMAGAGLEKQTSILYLTKSGDIIFDANRFFDVVDTSNNGTLSFSEINEVLCLSDEQLRAFIANMRGRTSPGDRSVRKDTEVSRPVFVKHFLDALADASYLEPTAKEAEDLFRQIAEEVGTNDSGEVAYDMLFHSSYLSAFLRDSQIYVMINRFKQRGGRSKGISEREWVEFYPLFLSQVCHPNFLSTNFMSTKNIGLKDEDDQLEPELGGLDVAFQNLCLTVDVGKQTINVVDDVTGRLRSSTMTAVMGGSGSGKSSLLNALCGRAFYGKVTGTVKINGNDSLIEEHKAVIGFVPQDDIVYPDLTVRENLLYSGRLQLPAGTTEEEISELADVTMASLGLSRIANSLVGDATRRGISGGEKKRVNIGLELMKRPKILFLDEPTSGLDSRSAFIVMESLKRLVSTQGMTVASVIHQPRTDIYDMFDSLFLLGVGGRTVYHGPALEARTYFENQGFQLPVGESQADWFLDISSGDVEQGDIEECGTNDEKAVTSKMSTKINGAKFEVTVISTNEKGTKFDLGQPDGVKFGNFVVREVGNVKYATASAENVIRVGDKVIGINGQGVGLMTMEDIHTLLREQTDDSMFVELVRPGVSRPEEESAREDDDHHSDNGEKAFLMSTNKAANEDGALIKSQEAREKLYRQFQVYFKNMPLCEKTQYLPPTAFSLPAKPKSVPWWRELIVQLRRNCLLSWRNRHSKIIDFGILFVAIFAMTLMGGVKSDKWSSGTNSLLWMKFISSKEDASVMLNPFVFAYALMGVNAITNYAMMVGLIVSVLIGLNATKIITDKKLQFYREAQSGASVTAFYIAANITATTEQGFAAAVGSLLAFFVLKPPTSFLSILWNFFMLSWLTVAWALLLAVMVPQDSVTTVVGFFCAFFGLLFNGKVAPGTWKSIYENPGLAVFSGFISPLRFFIEGISTSEAKCLPIQSGFTVASNAFNYHEFEESYPNFYHLTYMAHNDLDSATVQGCSGWFWWVPAAFAVGVTIRIAGGVAIHLSGRSKQGKKSVRKEIIEDVHKCRAGVKSIFQSFILAGIIVLFVCAGFLALSSWLILRKSPEQVNRTMG